jgi:hypothetical protein
MEYTINAKIFEQKPLVWGQIRQLVTILKGVEFRSGLTAAELIEILGDKIPSLLAVVLTEKGSSMKDKDIEKLATEFEFSLELDNVLQVVEDFFDCNPTASYLNKISSLVGKMTNEVEKTSTN